MMRHSWGRAFFALLAILLLAVSTSAQELQPGTKVFVICPGGGTAQLVDEDRSVQIEHGMLYRIEESAPNRYQVRHEGKAVYLNQDDVKPLDEALTWVNQQIDSSGPAADLYGLQTHILYNQQRLEEAMQASEKALELNPKHLKTLHYRAASAFFLNDVDTAEEIVEQLMELAPDNYLTQINAYYVASGRQDWTTARRALEKTVELNPWNGPLWANLAGFQFWSGDREAGFESLKKSIKADPSYPGAYGMYGVRAWEDGDKTIARKYLNDAAELNDDDWNTYRILMLIANEDGEHEQFRKMMIMATNCRGCSDINKRLFAWQLATSPTSERRDGLAALDIATALVDSGQIEPETLAHCLKAKAAAFAELERFDEALETLDLINPDSHDEQFKEMKNKFEEKHKFRDYSNFETHDL